jgi:hypothetical protein
LHRLRQKNVHSDETTGGRVNRRGRKDLAPDTTMNQHKVLTQHAPNTTHPLAIVRGFVTYDGSKLGGEGFSSVRNSLGTYTITFDRPFADDPIVTACIANPTLGTAADYYIYLASAGFVTRTSVRFLVGNGGNLINDCQFHFIAIGQRGL